MEIRLPSESFIVKATEGDKWLLTREGLPAAELEVNKTLNSVLDMQASAFASETGTDLGKWGLAPAGVVMSFKKKDGQTEVLLGKVKDKFYAKRSDKSIVYQIPKEAFDRASRPSKEYRDLKLAAFNRFDIKKIRIEHGPQNFELTKDNTQWKLTSATAEQIDNEKVDEYLSGLQDMKVSGFLNSTQKPKASEVSIHLFEKKGDQEKEVVTLSLTKPSGKNSVGMRTGLDRPFTVGETEFKKANAFKQQFLSTATPPKK